MAWLLGCRLAWMDLVKGPVGNLAQVLVLPHNQAWMGLVMVLRGTRALAGQADQADQVDQADQGSPSLGLGGVACSLLAVGTGHMTVG